MADETAGLILGLSELARQVRGSTLQFIDPRVGVDFLWTPPGTSNHILWHAGHALWAVDILVIEPLTSASELPPGWEETFGQDSRPQTNSKWPDMAEVRERLTRQLDRFLTLVAERAHVIAKQSDAVSPQNGWPLLPGLIHGWHDEARHQGEMYLLIKLWRAKV